MAKQTTERLQALEDAIYEVLNTRYKKDAKEAHALVESYGYKIDSAKRGYAVRNPETGRELEGWFNRQFDLLHFLNKPINKEYRTAQQLQGQRIGKAKERFIEVAWVKEDVKRFDRYIEDCKEDIARCMKRIDELQNNILSYKLGKMQAELKVEEYRAKLREEYGLKKGA